MKKQLCFFLNLLALVVLFTACKKNIAYEKQADPIKAYRMWFNRAFDASLTVKDKQLIGGDKYPLWQMAKQYSYNGLSIVEVPLVFKNRPIYGVKASGSHLQLPANASVSKLMIARNSAGGYRAAIVDIVADKAFYNAGGEVSQISLNSIPQNFAGYILSRNWAGEPQLGYRLEGGRAKQKIKPRKAAAQVTDDTEIKTSIAGDGIPFGILCAGCDFYMSAGDVASYPICATVSLACGLEMWDTDYTDPCSVEMGNIFGCPCESGVINYDNCGFDGGGGGNGNNENPNPIAITPCSHADSLAKNSEYKAKLDSLKGKTGGNKEYGYFYRENNGNDILEVPIDGPADSAGINFDVPVPIDGFMHNHYTGLLPVFSVDDLTSMAKIYTSGNMINPGTFTLGVVTASNTQYLLKIENEAMFAQFATSLIASDADKTYAYMYNEMYKILKSNTVAQNEQRFLQFLAQNKSGLLLFRGNADFTSWTPIKIDANDNIVINPC